MPIDAETRSFLDRLAADPPVVPPRSVEEFRAGLDAMSALDHPFEAVAQVEDVDIGAGVVARVLRPAGGGLRPAVVWVHGGSWVRGSVAATDRFLRILANRSDCVVVGVDYRRPPESPFPGPVDDVLAAVTWTGDQALALGIDARAVAVGGESTGGNLAAAAALAARDRGGPPVSHQLLLSPLLDARLDSASWAALGNGYGLSPAALRWAVEQYAPGVALDDPLLSPLAAADVGGLAPALVVTGEYDPLRDDGAAYAARLQAAGVSARHVRVPGLIHHAIVAPRAITLGARVLQQTSTAIGAWVRG
jgi:acetyl esterase/lipase